MHADIEKYSYNIKLEENVQDNKQKIKVAFTKKITNKTQEHHHTIFYPLLIIKYEKKIFMYSVSLCICLINLEQNVN